MQSKYDVAVIGGGPGGYIAAIRLAQLGKKTVLVEERDLGGTCLNWGCIPTKALLHSAEIYHTVKTAAAYGVQISGEASFDYAKIAARKDSVVKKLRGGIQGLLKAAGVEVISGRASLEDANTVLVDEKTRFSAQSIILATGSKPAGIPVPGAELALNSDSVLSLQACPESVVIIGGGVIGIEFASLFNALGKKVTVIEMLPAILSGADEEITAMMEKSLKKRGIEIYTDARVTGIEKSGSGIVCAFENAGESKKAEGEICIVAAGRKPLTENLGLEKAGITLQRGFVTVDEQMRTSVSSVYAIGDITGKIQLAHVASAQGLVAAHNAAGESKTMTYNIIPSCIYTSPEIASVGLTEKEALAKGYEAKTGSFPTAANGKAMVMGESEGIVKIVTDERTGEVLGAHLMAPHATDMIAELCALMKAEGTIEELAGTVHPHPTVSEMVMEAAHDVEGQCCHKIN